MVRLGSCWAPLLLSVGPVCVAQETLCDSLLCAPEYKYKNDWISFSIQYTARLGDQWLQIITMAKLLGSLKIAYICCIVRMPTVTLFLSRKNSLREEINKPCSSGGRLIDWWEEVHFLRRTSVSFLLHNVLQCCLKQRLVRTSTEVHCRRAQLWVPLFPLLEFRKDFAWSQAWSWFSGVLGQDFDAWQ